MFSPNLAPFASLREVSCLFLLCAMRFAVPSLQKSAVKYYFYSGYRPQWRYVFVCRRLPTNKKSTSLRPLRLCGEMS
jgi:hypothetical protein